MIRLMMVGFILLGACAAMNRSDTQDIALIEARIDSIEDIQGNEEIDLSMWVKLKLVEVKSLIGDVGANRIEVELKIGGQPNLDKINGIYVLGKKQPDGTFQVLDWDYAFRGLCVDHDLARTYQLEDAIQKLKREGKVKWNPACNW